MADWQERVQSMIIGFVFAYMVMKLFSVISSFRAGNLRVARATDEEGSLSEVEELVPGEERAAALVATDEETEADGGDEQEGHGDSAAFDSDVEDDAAPASRPREIDTADEPTVSEVESKDEDLVAKNDEEVEFMNDEGIEDLGKTEPKEAIASGEQSLKALSEEVGGDLEEELDDENEIDDWEGVESTELEKMFGAASTHADAMVAMPGVNPSSEAMLQLHAFYKIATEGPCSSSQPSAFQPTARAKWNEWQKLGSMPQEEAMQKYIALLTKIDPNWHEEYQKRKEPAKEAAEQKHEEFSESNDKMEAMPVLSDLVTSGDGGQADTVEQGPAT